MTEIKFKHEEKDVVYKFNTQYLFIRKLNNKMAIVTLIENGFDYILHIVYEDFTTNTYNYAHLKSAYAELTTNYSFIKEIEKITIEY